MEEGPRQLGAGRGTHPPVARGSGFHDLHAGSNAGIPVSILNSFAAPPQGSLTTANCCASESIRRSVACSGSWEWRLTRRKAAKRFSANVIQHAWENGHDLELGSLIQEIQSPGVQRIGVMDVETFYPAKAFHACDRDQRPAGVAGVRRVAGRRAAGYSAHLLHGGRQSRASQFFHPHLNDAERMFFVTLLLNQLLGWMRAIGHDEFARAAVHG